MPLVISLYIYDRFRKMTNTYVESVAANVFVELERKKLSQGVEHKVVRKFGGFGGGSD